MKKIILFLLALIGLLSYAVAKGNEDQNANCPCIKEFKIVMDRNGQVAEIWWNNSKIYTPPSSPDNIFMPVDPFMVRLPCRRAFPKALGVGTQVTIAINGIIKDNDKFKIAVTSQKSKYELVPIFTGKTELPSKKVPEIAARQMCSFILDESGTTYKIEVTRADLNPPQGKVIFDESLQTKARYYFGSHVGVFYPFRESAEYSLGYASPNDVNTTIMENKLRNVTMVIVGAVYPFGFEPEGKTFSYGRIQLNLATELSSSIFKKIYFGPGYDFTYFSLSVLFRFGATQEVQSGFKVGDQVSSSIKTVPTVSKNRLDWGLTVCLPLDLMIGWLGKSLGIK
jgi:hypothetical protein